MTEPTIAFKGPAQADIEPGIYLWCACRKATISRFATDHIKDQNLCRSYLKLRLNKRHGFAVANTQRTLRFATALIKRFR